MSQRYNFNQMSPDLTKKLIELGQISRGGINPALLDLINIRTSLINGCAFCVDMHVKEAKIHGERELRVHHVAIWRESTLFSEKERAALEWTEAVTKLSDHGISNEIYLRVREHFSEKEVSDLTFAIGVMNLWNRVSISSGSVPGSLDAAYGLTKAGLS